MSGVPVGESWQHEYLVGHRLTAASGHSTRTNQIDIQRQVVAVLFDRTARQNADLVVRDRVVDLWPGQLFVPVFTRSSTTHLWLSHPAALAACLLIFENPMARCHMSCLPFHSGWPTP